MVSCPALTFIVFPPEKRLALSGFAYHVGPVKFLSSITKDFETPTPDKLLSLGFSNPLAALTKSTVFTSKPVLLGSLVTPEAILFSNLIPLISSCTPIESFASRLTTKLFLKTEVIGGAERSLSAPAANSI